MSKQKHAVITGGGTGIGAAIATTLADQGFSVTLMGRRLEPLQQLAESLGNNAQAVACDVTDIDATAAAFSTACASFGVVDILVNNAGAAPTSPFHRLGADDWRKVMAVNLDGVFNCTRQVIDAMLERRSGRIINIASTAAQRGYAYVSAYTAAKHGVLGLTRALALETANKGITVNAICPGYTDTDMTRRTLENIRAATGRDLDAAHAELVRHNPQGRLVEPGEVAEAVAWLCEEASAAVTGQAIAIAGGEVM